MKRKTTAILLAVMMIFAGHASAKDASGSWYCMHTKNGVRPCCPSEMSYIEEHNAVFIGEDDKVIYLTFDAGYENGNIEKILDTLKSENVHGAFFVLENLIKTNTDLVKRMADEGHLVCNHTCRHGDMTKVTEAEFVCELTKLERIAEEYAGVTVAKFFRPPEGRLSNEMLTYADNLGYTTVLWSFAYADWDNGKQMSADKAINKIMSGLHNGEILLLHPTSATNAEILPTLIKKLKESGYRFGTLDELAK